MPLLLPVGMILLAWAVSSHAASVLVDLHANYNDPTPPPSGFTSDNNPPPVTQATGPVSDSLSHYTASTNATASYGSLQTNVIIGTTTNDDSSIATAKASWEDSLTIAGSGFGSVKFSFTFTGSLAASGGGDSSVAQGNFNLSGNVNGNTFAHGGQLHSSFGPTGESPADFTTTNYLVNFGIPFTFNMTLENTASYVGSLAATSGSASAAGFELTLTGIEVYDQFNTLISSPVISSESGYVYGVPEPSRTLFVLLGTALLSQVRRRHR